MHKASEMISKSDNIHFPFFSTSIDESFCSSSRTKHTIKHIVVDTPHKRLFTPSITFMSENLVCTFCWCRELYSSSTLYPAFSHISNLYDDGDVDDSTKMDKQLVWTWWLRRKGKIEKIQSHLLCYRRIFTPNHFYASQRVYVLSSPRKHIAITK